MNDTTSHSECAGENPRSASAGGQCVFDRMCSGFRRGAEDARQAAQEAVPKLRSLAAQVAYGVAYGLSYGGTFGFTVANELCPPVIKDGLRDGVQQGRTAAEAFAARFRRPSEPATTSEPPVQPPPIYTAPPQTA